MMSRYLLLSILLGHSFITAAAGAAPPSLTKRCEQMLSQQREYDKSHEAGTVAAVLESMAKEMKDHSLEEILPLLQHKEWEIRTAAARAIIGNEKARRPDVRAALARAVASDENMYSLPEVIQAAYYARASEATPALCKIMLKSPHAHVRHAAVEAQYWIADPKSVPALLHATEDKDSKVARRAVWVLGRIGDLKALPGIRAIAFNREGDMQLLAVQVLGIMGDSHSSARLLEMLDTADERLTIRIIISLGNMKCEEAVPRLVRLASHKNPEIAAGGHEALSEIVDLKALTRFLERWKLNPTTRSFLVAVSSDRLLRTYFWQTLRQEERKLVPWEKAKELILKGEIVSVMQSHSLEVSMEGRNGALYKTTESRIDEVHRLIRQVDPKGVFISYGTE